MTSQLRISGRSLDNHIGLLILQGDLGGWCRTGRRERGSARMPAWRRPCVSRVGGRRRVGERLRTGGCRLETSRGASGGPGSGALSWC